MSESKPPIRMIYFVGEGVFSSVLDSQVVVPLGLLGRRAPHIRRALLILTSGRHGKDARVPSRERVIRDALPGVNVRFKYRPIQGVPFEHRLWGSKLQDAISECGYEGDAPIIVHCRGEITAAAAAWLKRRDSRIRILLDLRGAQADEIRGRGLLAWYLRGFSRRTLAEALGAADAMNTVSQGLADYVHHVQRAARPIPSCVVRCCVDIARFFYDPMTRSARRTELGVEDKFVVCYCGSMLYHQRPDAVAEAVAVVLGRMSEAHFLIVSQDARTMVDLLERRGVHGDRVTVRSARHDEVASYLMAADVGLLLRENTLTNRVASPVKFAEYLRCGVPVILTPYVGDCGDFVKRFGVGQTVEFPPGRGELIEAVRVVRERLRAEPDDYRRRCSDLAAEHLSWEGQLGTLMEMYRALALT